MEESLMPFSAESVKDMPYAIITIVGVWLILKLVLPYVAKRKLDPEE